MCPIRRARCFQRALPLIYFSNTFSICPTFFSTLPASFSIFAFGSQVGVIGDLGLASLSRCLSPHVLPLNSSFVLWFIGFLLLFWFLLFAFDVMQISARHPFRFGRVQSRETTKTLDHSRYRRQPEFPFWIPDWLTVYPELPAWNFYVAIVKTFSGRVCSKALTLIRAAEPPTLVELLPPNWTS